MINDNQCNEKVQITLSQQSATIKGKVKKNCVKLIISNIEKDSGRKDELMKREMKTNWLSRQFVIWKSKMMRMENEKWKETENVEMMMIMMKQKCQEILSLPLILNNSLRKDGNLYTLEYW